MALSLLAFHAALKSIVSFQPRPYFIQLKLFIRHLLQKIRFFDQIREGVSLNIGIFMLQYFQYICFTTCALFSALHANTITKDVNQTAVIPLTLPWNSSYEAGLEEAKKQNLPIYLSFTAPDWCSFCKIMEEKIYSTTDFTQAVQGKFIFIKVILPRSGEMSKETKELTDRFHITGIPVVVILSADGSQEMARFSYTRAPAKTYAEEVLKSIKN